MDQEQAHSAKGKGTV